MNASATVAPRLAPSDFAPCTLFEPIAAYLERFVTPTLPDADGLNAVLDKAAPGAVTASGRAVRFAHVAPSAEGYEAFIHDTGQIPTRRDDWHDFFNALSWCAWPRSKAALNAAHMREISIRRKAGLAGRGRARDALTQFDECGLLVVTSDEALPSRLRMHEWETVFVAQRTGLVRTTRFLVFGHGAWDQLRAPFVGLCAKTLHYVVPPDWFSQPPAVQQADADCWLATRIADPDVLPDPRALAPLPLLGIPGVTPDSESPAYYRDTRQFRPRRAA